MFAQPVVDDYSLSQSSACAVAEATQEQLSDSKAHTIEPAEDDESSGAAPAQSADDDIWWERCRNKPRTESGGAKRKKRKSNPGPGPSDPTMSYITIEPGGCPAADQNQDDDSMGEMRILIKVSSWAPPPFPACVFLT